MHTVELGREPHCRGVTCWPNLFQPIPKGPLPVFKQAEPLEEAAKQHTDRKPDYSFVNDLLAGLFIAGCFPQSNHRAANADREKD